MKKTLILLILTSFSLMAQTKAGVELSVPLGTGIGFHIKDGKDAKIMNSDGGFEGGVYLKPYGYLSLGVISLGASLDLGYQRDSFAFKTQNRDGRLIHTFDSFSIGITPRIDVLFLSIGLGAGIKFPLGGGIYTKDAITGSEFSQYYNYKELKQKFEHLYIPYIRANVDFLLLYNFILGIYMNYDFPTIKYKTLYDDVGLGAFDIGAEIGIRF